MLYKIFNYISVISSIITIILLYIFMIISDSFNFNGCTILMILLLLLNPIANICRLKKKIINNPIYHIFIIILTSYISYILINSIIIYNQDKSLAYNLFYDKLLYIFIAIIIILLITLMLKKTIKKSTKNNSKIMLIIILLTSLLPLLTHSSIPLISAGFAIALFIFTIITLFKLTLINTANELRSYYLILIVCSLIAINPLAFVLSIYIFLQLDTFGLHI